MEVSLDAELRLAVVRAVVCEHAEKNVLYGIVGDSMQSFMRDPLFFLCRK